MNDLDLCLEVVSRSCEPLRYIRRWISRKPLEIEAWFQRTTNRKWHDVTWLRRDVTPKVLEAVRSAILTTTWLLVFHDVRRALGTAPHTRVAVCRQHRCLTCIRQRAPLLSWCSSVSDGSELIVSTHRGDTLVYNLCALHESVMLWLWAGDVRHALGSGGVQNEIKRAARKRRGSKTYTKPNWTDYAIRTAKKPNKFTHRRRMTPVSVFYRALAYSIGLHATGFQLIADWSVLTTDRMK